RRRRRQEKSARNSRPGGRPVWPACGDSMVARSRSLAVPRRRHHETSRPRDGATIIRAIPMRSLFYPWGVILQLIAIVHFVRRRPETFWLWIIIFFGGPGAFVYLLVEMLPDLGLMRHSMGGFSRRRRINTLRATILDNPSAGNYEELGDL